jgi:hypothetical protein
MEKCFYEKQNAQTVPCSNNGCKKDLVRPKFNFLQIAYFTFFANEF